jgi:hypothetical protein
VIDFVKVEAVLSSEIDLTAHPLLIDLFSTSINNQTGEVKTIEAHYNNLLFKHQGNKLFVQGSLHKYYNFLIENHAPNQFTQYEISKGFNGDDFTLANLQFSINHLCDTFKIDRHKSRITNLEFGVNLELDGFRSKSVLNGLLRHHGAMFNKPLQNTFRRLYHSQYSIKVYDKALQYNIPNEVLRIELNFCKMLQLNQHGVYFLNQLTDESILKELGKLRVTRWDEVLFYDPTINEAKLNSYERLKLANYKNENYWDAIASNRMYKPKKVLTDLTNRFSNLIQSKISVELITKWEQLLIN